MHLDKIGLATIASVSIALFSAAEARADEPATEGAPAEAAAAEAPAAASPPSEGVRKEAASGPREEVDEDGVRFRGGISGGGGGMFLNGYSLGLGGIDGRLGVQIMDLVGVYVQPQLAIYGGSVGGVTGIGGIVGGSAVVDFTFLDQIFVGIGGGGALLNNPAGGELHIRAGGYPVFGYGEDNIVRKGLMIGADLRMFFVSGLVLISPTVSIGYEAF